MEVLVRNEGRGATAGSVSNRGLEGEGTREGSAGRHEIMTHVVLASQG